MRSSAKHRWIFPLFVLAVFFLLSINLASEEIIREQPKGLNLSCPQACNEWDITLDDYGYSDWINFRPLSVPSHEMLSGEWAAAIYYNGIPNGQSMWLTRQFICPTFTTNSDFQVTQPMTYIGGTDSAEAVIYRLIPGDSTPDTLKITIGYHLVCEGSVAMGVGTTYIPSTACIMRATYTINNIPVAPDSSTITGVRFYQMLHGHPANNYDGGIRGVYDDSLYNVLNLANHHYDITIWGPSTYGDTTEYIGLSSANVPSRYEVSSFNGHSSEPTSGIYTSVKNHSLTNTKTYGPGEVGGAMEWTLGDIGPGGTRQVTVLLSMATGGRQWIPSLTGWGLLVLVAMIILAAIIVIIQRRRRPALRT
jgi:hypothetical protein